MSIGPVCYRDRKPVEVPASGGGDDASLMGTHLRSPKEPPSRSVEKRQPRIPVIVHVKRSPEVSRRIEERQPDTLVGVQREQDAHPSPSIPEAQAVGGQLDTPPSPQIAENQSIEADRAELQGSSWIVERRRTI